jgi:hypothetical protein
MADTWVNHTEEMGRSGEMKTASKVVEFSFWCEKLNFYSERMLKQHKIIRIYYMSEFHEGRDRYLSLR